MGFIAHPLQQLQGAAFRGKPQRFFLTRTINFFKFLGQTDDRQVAEVQLFEFLASGLQLAFAAIDEDEVGDVGPFVGRWGS